MTIRIAAISIAALLGTPTYAQSELAIEAVEAMAFDQQLDQTFEVLDPSMGQIVFNEVKDLQLVRSFVTSDQGSEDSFIAIYNEEFLTAVRAQYPTLRQAMAAQLDKAFSGEELRELIAFYQSPIGKKLTDVQPELAIAMGAFGERVGVSAGGAALDATLSRISLDHSE